MRNLPPLIPVLPVSRINNMSVFSLDFAARYSAVREAERERSIANERERDGEKERSEDSSSRDF